MNDNRIKSELFGGHFIEEGRRSFSFLIEQGFTEVEATPTLLEFHNPETDIDADVYFEPGSYEIGLQVNRSGVKCSLSEMIRLAGDDSWRTYRDFAATTIDGVAEGLARLAELTKRFGQRALRGDPEFFGNLERERRLWTHEYALDVLESQLRPKADQAFRAGDYRTAAELYARIQSRLTSAEIKKLEIAKTRV